MAIKSFKVSNLRNLSSVKINPSATVNLFFGDNGSGKTSLLEAVYFLAVARSFRTGRLLPVIKKGERLCTVYGEISLAERLVRVGVSRGVDSQQAIRINDDMGAVNQLVDLLPVQLINSDIFVALERGPVARRRLLDWGVFYFSDKFLPVWKIMQSSLKQRNSLLKRKDMSIEELSVWTRSFTDSAKIVDRLRFDYFETLTPEINRMIVRLAEMPNIRFSYYQGWSRHTSLEDVLKKDINRDRLLGCTTSGPHKADFRVLCDGLSAVDVLSRGQQKILLCLIKLAQGILFEKMTGRRCIYLVDDPFSELDRKHCGILADLLCETRSQLWVTGVNKQDLSDLFSKSSVEKKMFHVEHGSVSL